MEEKEQFIVTRPLLAALLTTNFPELLRRDESGMPEVVEQPRFGKSFYGWSFERTPQLMQFFNDYKLNWLAVEAQINEFNRSVKRRFAEANGRTQPFGAPMSAPPVPSQVGDAEPVQAELLADELQA